MPARPSPFDPYQIEYAVVRARNRLHFRLAPKDEPDAYKVFVLGHPRTGTGTLHRIFVDNGLRSLHSAGNWKTRDYDCFSDRGNYQPFDLLDHYYGNAVFVLNTRPAARYLRSRMNQTLRRRAKRRQPRPRFSAANIRNEILRRNEHFFAFARHFRGSDKFLVVNIERPGAFTFVCERLGLELPGDVWKNRTSGSMSEAMARNIESAFAQLGASDAQAEPFVLRALLDDRERQELDEFLRAHRDRIFL